MRDLASPRIAQVPLALLRDRLTAVAQFVKIQETKEGWKEIPCHPPDWCVPAVAARGNWPKIRPLRGLVTAPVLKPDGTILETLGYDVASGLLYKSDGQSYSIPLTPSLDDARKALDSIKQENSLNRASATVADEIFCAAKINPLIELLSQSMTAWLGPMFAGPNEKLCIWIDPAVAHDPELDLKRWELGSWMGAVTKNEFRRHVLNLRDTADGNVTLSRRRRDARQ